MKRKKEKRGYKAKKKSAPRRRGPTNAKNLLSRFEAGEDVLDYFDLNAGRFVKIPKLRHDHENRPSPGLPPPRQAPARRAGAGEQE
jgi:hypothetical protein